MITTVDKLKSELVLINDIFKAQFKKVDKDYPLQYPIIRDNKSHKPIDGRYFAYMDIFSNNELFNIQLYKQYFTKRFEKKLDSPLLRNQLLEIKEFAEKALDFYKRELSDKSNIVKQYHSFQGYKISEKLNNAIKHSAVISISNNNIEGIIIGVNRHDCIINKRDYDFNYYSSNSILAQICFDIVKFIEKFEYHNIDAPMGFKSSLEDDSVKKLYEELNGWFFETTLTNFNAFLNEGIVKHKIKYVNNKSNGYPHVTSLREFFALLDIKPTQSKISKILIDMHGNEIILPKPKKNEYSNYYAKLEKIIKIQKTDL